MGVNGLVSGHSAVGCGSVVCISVGSDGCTFAFNNETCFTRHACMRVVPEVDELAAGSVCACKLTLCADVL